MKEKELIDTYKDQIKEAKQVIIEWYKDNNIKVDFPEELHLADIIEMHLFRYGVKEYAEWKIKELYTWLSPNKYDSKKGKIIREFLDQIIANKDKK